MNKCIFAFMLGLLSSFVCAQESVADVAELDTTFYFSASDFCLTPSHYDYMEIYSGRPDISMDGDSGEPSLMIGLCEITLNGCFEKFQWTCDTSEVLYCSDVKLLPILAIWEPIDEPTLKQILTQFQYEKDSYPTMISDVFNRHDRYGNTTFIIKYYPLRYDTRTKNLYLIKKLHIHLTAYRETDAIHDISAPEMVNGTSSDGKWYDLSGRRIGDGQWKMDNGQLPRGVYIRDGKKMLVK